MIICKELKKEFGTKKEMFQELVLNKAEIIALKKSATKFTDNSGLACMPVMKSIQTKQALGIGDVVTNVINTTNYLDSHNDLHVNGIWNKSVKDQQGKIYQVINHDLNLGSIVGYPKDVTMEVRSMPWRTLGLNSDGLTEALLFHTRLTDKTNRDAFLAYRDGEAIQHSIRMEYVNIMLAIDDEDIQEEYKTFKTYLPIVINQQVAQERGYFWVVAEAKIKQEGSTVLFGSNDITPSLGFDTGTLPQPQKSTDEQPQEFNVSEAISKLKFFQN